MCEPRPSHGPLGVCERSEQSIVAVRNWVIDNHNAVNRDLNKPVLSRKKAREQIKPVRQADIKRMLGFIRKNMEQNNPPSSYRAGAKILQRHLDEILSVIGPLNRPGPRPPRPRPRPRHRRSLAVR